MPALGGMVNKKRQLWANCKIVYDAAYIETIAFGAKAYTKLFTTPVCFVILLEKKGNC